MAAVHLLLGDDEFLIDRAAQAVTRVVKAAAPHPTEVIFSKMRAGEVTAAELSELLSPSLFAEDRVMYLENVAEAGKEPAALILEAARQPPEGITLLIAHSGGGRTKAMVNELKKFDIEIHDCVAPKGNGRNDFVRNEFRNLDIRVSNEVVEQLLLSVGADLRELAAAISQLVADTGGKVDVAAVAKYYSGRAEVTGFEIADYCVEGNKNAALEALRWALHRGTPHVLIADALAEAIQGVARAKGLATSDQYAAASALGTAPWRAKKLMTQARRWQDIAVAQALIIVATLNGEVKGQGADPDYCVELAVIKVAELAGK